MVHLKSIISMPIEINKKIVFLSIGLTPPIQVPIDLHVKFAYFDSSYLAFKTKLESNHDIFLRSQLKLSNKMKKKSTCWCLDFSQFAAVLLTAVTPPC